MPDKRDYLLLSKAIPKTVFVNGIKDLGLIALINWNNFDNYVSDAFQWIEAMTWSSNEPENLRHQRRLSRPAYQQTVELLLDCFYRDFTALAEPILGDYEPHLEKVVSMEPINAICVELSHGTQPRATYCSAR